VTFRDLLDMARSVSEKGKASKDSAVLLSRELLGVLGFGLELGTCRPRHDARARGVYLPPEANRWYSPAEARTLAAELLRCADCAEGEAEASDDLPLVTKRR
jgi:hypothetical protein